MSEPSTPEKPQLRRTFHAVIPHYDPAASSILICPQPEGDGWVLPSYEPEDGFFALVEPLNKGIKELLGVDVITLRCLKFEVDRDVKRSVDAIQLMENRNSDWNPTAPMRWVSRETLASVRLAIEEQRPVIEDWFAEMASGIIPPRRSPWAVRGWYDEATEWVRDRLSEYGLTLTRPLEQVKQWGISSILRVPTAGGNYYLKAANSLFAREPAITRALSKIYPGQVPDPIAILVEPEQGWMLMRDFGDDEDNSADPTAVELEPVLRMYARMQLGCIDRVEELLSLGFADRRLNLLSEQIDELLADPNSMAEFTGEEIEKLKGAVPRVRAACAQLENYGVPQTLGHGDFHDGNIIARNGEYLIFDWTDACIAYPFLDLAVILDSGRDSKWTSEERERLRDTYLEQWTAYAPIEQLREAAELAHVLGSLHQAVSYKNISTSLEEAARFEFNGALGSWLRPVLDL